MRARKPCPLTLAVASTLLLAGCSGGGESVEATAAPTATTFRYYATGGGEAFTGQASVTMGNPAGGTKQADIALPLKDTEGARGVGGTATPGSFLYIAVQNKAAFGSVTCQIEVDGVIVSENTSHGGYVIASCEYAV